MLVERGRAPQAGYWSLPGGVLEAGERIEDGLRREVLEETGLRVKPARLITVFERILRDARGKPEYHYVLVDYLCRVSGGRLNPGDDVRRAEWVDRRALRNYRITEGTRPVIERAFRAARK